MLNVIDRAIQIHSALGYTADISLEAMYRTGRALRLADGAAGPGKNSASWWRRRKRVRRSDVDACVPGGLQSVAAGFKLAYILRDRRQEE